MIEGVVMATGERREEKQQNTEGDTGKAGENEQRKIEEDVGEGMEETDGGERGGSWEPQGSMGEGYGVNNGNLEPNGTEGEISCSS